MVNRACLRALIAAIDREKARRMAAQEAEAQRKPEPDKDKAKMKEVKKKQ